MSLTRVLRADVFTPLVAPPPGPPAGGHDGDDGADRPVAQRDLGIVRVRRLPRRVAVAHRASLSPAPPASVNGTAVRMLQAGRGLRLVRPQPPAAAARGYATRSTSTLHWWACRERLRREAPGAARCRRQLGVDHQDRGLDVGLGARHRLGRAPRSRHRPIERSWPTCPRRPCATSGPPRRATSPGSSHPTPATPTTCSRFSDDRWLRGEAPRGVARRRGGEPDRIGRRHADPVEHVHGESRRGRSTRSGRWRRRRRGTAAMRSRSCIDPVWVADETSIRESANLDVANFGTLSARSRVMGVGARAQVARGCGVAPDAGRLADRRGAAAAEPARRRVGRPGRRARASAGGRAATTRSRAAARRRCHLVLARRRLR